MQPAIDKEATYMNPKGEEQPENFSHPKRPVEKNDGPTTKTATEVEMVLTSFFHILYMLQCLKFCKTEIFV